ncbi:hypothetical protein [Spirulina sp. 06S082]|uniref:hypothetical protein n=1 Tax=Spirulina sp. 06S082 TaxID=3110248 RepID=UPI002B2059F2|nr:hypothetical protein [Spirulina sp. 06S082]
MSHQDRDCVYLVSTPNQSRVCNTIEQVLEVIEPFVLEESLYTGEPDLLYEVPYLLDCQGYMKGKNWEVTLTPRI